jgi:SAM-dependent methyltransferase
MTNWEIFFNKKIKEIAKEKIVRDLGGGHPFQKNLAKHRGCFKNSDYKTLDINPDSNPDIVGDIQDLPFKSESIDAVICNSVLEHVKNPFKAVEEINRVLRPGGKCFVYVPFIHVYHGNDYWRFSEDGIRHLFRDFQEIEICPVRYHFETIAYLLPHQNKFPMCIFVYIARFIDKVLESHESKKQVSGYNVFLIK